MPELGNDLSRCPCCNSILIKNDITDCKNCRLNHQGKNVEQALRKEVAVLHRRNAALKKRIKTFIVTCDKRKKQMQEDATFRSVLKRKSHELYFDIVSEVTGDGPSKSCIECHDDGVECPEGTERRSIICLRNLKKLRKTDG